MRRSHWFLAAVAILIVMTGGIAWGQVRTSAEAEIPFDFYVGNLELPAGNYSFTLDRGLQVLHVAGVEGGAYRLVITGNQSKVPDACLVFHKYPDGSHFLAEYRLNGTSSVLRESPLEEHISTDWKMQQIVLNLSPEIRR